jgi:hypothetical protein
MNKLNKMISVLAIAALPLWAIAAGDSRRSLDLDQRRAPSPN